MDPSFYFILSVLLLFPTMSPCSSIVHHTEPTFQTRYYTQIIDHFTFRPESSMTFQQKYLVYDDHWGGATSKSPIFVYSGNEGSVDVFANNTGLMIDIAPRFKAMVVFIEHRYYGESIPFGGAEEGYRNASTFGYLSTSQALADFTTLVVNLKKNLTCKECPVVAFGGSYGGALATWLRMKYPNIFLGALASSAPVLSYDNELDPYCFFDTITNNFRNESMSCYETIKDSWEAIDKIANLSDGIATIERTLRICKGQAIPDDVKHWLRSAYFRASMVDYPTPANLQNPLPAYPVKQMCKAIDDPKAGDDILIKLYGAMNIFYNFTGDVNCFDIALQSNPQSPMEWQMSTEFLTPLPLGSRNGSMFPIEDPVVSKEDYWVATEYGGHLLGSILSNISESLVTIVAPQGAHHVDLRYSTMEDPQWLVDVREKEIEIIASWLTTYYNDLHV